MGETCYQPFVYIGITLILSIVTIAYNVNDNFTLGAIISKLLCASGSGIGIFLLCKNFSIVAWIFAVLCALSVGLASVKFTTSLNSLKVNSNDTKQDSNNKDLSH